ncbi:MAG TPA: hypothetical protein VEN79_02160, partial [Terriglobia bacterium]|nr:hypothetical protein [Terriglobia bacterium]
GGTDRSTASPLETKAGEHTHLEFALKPGPGFHVSGGFIGFPAGQTPSITVAARSGEQVFSGAQINPVNATFTIPKIPAGVYVIKAAGPAGDGTAIVAETMVNVSGDLGDVRLVAQSGISIPVVVHHESGASAAPADQAKVLVRRWVQGVYVFMTLQPTAEGAEPVTQVQAAPEGEGLVLRNVTPGSYSVSIEAPGYVRSATSGSTDLLREDLVVPAGAAVPPIEVTVAKDTGSLTLKGLNADPGVQVGVVIVPETALRRPRILGVYDGHDGDEVTISGLAPGDFEVFAFEDLDDIEYMNPQVLEQYASQAAHVTIPANGQASVTINLIPAEGH